MTDSAIAATVERFWRVRVEGDKEGMRAFLAPGATYEMMGAKAFADSGMVGPHAMTDVVGPLADTFKFHELEIRDIVVDGARAASVGHAVVSHRGGAPVATIFCDMWVFDGAGKIVSMRQFVDTDLVRRMIAGAV